MKNAATVAALLISLLPQNASARKKPHEAVVGYIFAGRGGPLDGSTIAAKKMTRINYAFFGLQDGLVAARSANDAANLGTLVALKKINPKLEVVVSVGGGGDGSAGFSDMAITPEGRRRFVDSAIAVIDRYNLDGIDIDWEYPGYTHANTTVRPEDKQTYTLLLKELRERLDKEGARVGRHLITSSATGATTIWLEHTEMGEVSKYLDSVNMMCYDWYNPVEKNTGHDSPLYTDPADPKAISIDRAVKMNLARPACPHARSLSAFRSTVANGREWNPPTTACSSPSRPPHHRRTRLIIFILRHWLTRKATSGTGILSRRRPTSTTPRPRPSLLTTTPRRNSLGPSTYANITSAESCSGSTVTIRTTCCSTPLIRASE